MSVSLLDHYPFLTFMNCWMLCWHYLQMILQNKGCELVQCRLTLGYDHWPMDEVFNDPLWLTLCFVTSAANMSRRLRKLHDYVSLSTRNLLHHYQGVGTSECVCVCKTPWNFCLTCPICPCFHCFVYFMVIMLQIIPTWEWMNMMIL